MTRPQEMNPKLLNMPGHKTTYFDAPKSAASAVKTPTGPNLGKFAPDKGIRDIPPRTIQANPSLAKVQAKRELARSGITPTVATPTISPTIKKTTVPLATGSGAKISTAPPPPKAEVPLTLKQKIKQGAKKAFAPGTQNTQAGVGRKVAGTVGGAATTAYLFNTLAGKPEPPDKTIHSTAPLAASFERIPSEGEQRLDELKTDRLATRKTRMYQGGERGSEIK